MSLFICGFHTPKSLTYTPDNSGFEYRITPTHTTHRDRIAKYNFKERIQPHQRTLIVK